MSALRTFVSDITPWPRRRDDWEGIARLVSRVLEQRQTGYPRQIELGNLTQDDADQRIRVMTSINQVWARVIDRQDLPQALDCGREFGSTLSEIQAEAAMVRDRFAQLAEARPDDRDAAADREHSEALWWHLQPIVAGSSPHIWIAHGHAQWELAQRRRGRAA